MTSTSLVEYYAAQGLSDGRRYPVDSPSNRSAVRVYGEELAVVYQQAFDKGRAEKREHFSDQPDLLKAYTYSSHYATPEQKWARAEEVVRRQVALLNETLGFGEDAQHKVTFGYIGNLPFGSKEGGVHDDRSFSVYLPHPHRAGTDEDRLGSVRYGDHVSLAALAGQVAAFRKGILWAGQQKGVVQAANNTQSAVNVSRGSW